MRMASFDSPIVPTSSRRPAGRGAGPVGLLLTGGGARAAYQAGVLQAIAELRRTTGAHAGASPFAIVTGTSAGAINAAAVASHADDFDRAVHCLVGVWAGMRPEQVYRADALSAAAGGWRMLFGLARLLHRWRRWQPRSLLDNAPLAELLRRAIPLQRLPMLMAAGHLQALAVSASSYSSGEHYTFYQSARPIPPWLHAQRVAMPARITHAHLLASSAIPFVFPASAIAMPGGHTEFFGDGSMRQSAPLAAAVRLGAGRILAIGSGRMQEPQGAQAPNALAGYPTLAQIAGHALASVFLDSLSSDAEHMRHINEGLAHLPPAARAGTGLRPVELLVIAPSERIDVIASRHAAALPTALRGMMGCAQANARRETSQASALASYLLFDSGFTRELMALGRADTMRQREAVLAFFGWEREAAAEPHGCATCADSERGFTPKMDD